MAHFSIRDARTNLSTLVAKALGGDEVIIRRRNVPAVRLVPIAPRGQRRFGALKGRIAIDARFDAPLPKDELGGWDLA